MAVNKPSQTSLFQSKIPFPTIGEMVRTSNNTPVKHIISPTLPITTYPLTKRIRKTKANTKKRPIEIDESRAPSLLFVFGE